jgi:cytochrome P450
MTPSCTASRAPGAVPVLGHLPCLLRDPCGFLSALPAYGDLVEVRLGPLRAVVVCRPDLARQMLLDHRTFDKGGPVYDRAREALGTGLATCPYGAHRQQRALLQPLFRPARYPGYAAIMTKHITAEVEAWGDGQVIDVLPTMHALTTRVGLSTVFAAPVDSTLLTELHRAINETLMAMHRRIFIPPQMDRLPLLGKRRYDRSRARLRQITDGFIAQYRQSGVDHQDLLSALLATHENGQSLSDAEVCDQVMNMFVAGTDTVAAALAWAVYLMARHPDVQRRLQHEADTILTDGIATWNDLPKLDYTHRVVTEILRLYPPAWMLSRTVSADTELGGHPIPAGTTIMFSAYPLHHSPDLYPEPERFDPDRWADGHAPLPSGAFVPFSHGARRCIGDKFAMTEAALCLATTAARWDIHLTSDRSPRPLAKPILSPSKTLLRLSRRTTPHTR